MAVMGVGSLLSVLQVLSRVHRESGEGLVRHFREKVGRSILLGLELLVAADIIRTVSEEPTLRGVMVLGMIVLIRTFLSFTLAVELEGHWPWQRARLGEAKRDSHTPPARTPGTESRPPEQ